MSHVEGHVAANEESLAVDDLVVPVDELVPLMRPDLLRLLVDVLVRLGTDVVAASLDREIKGLEGHRAGRRAHDTLVLGFDLVHQPLEQTQAACEPETESSAAIIIVHRSNVQIEQRQPVARCTRR